MNEEKRGPGRPPKPGGTVLRNVLTVRLSDWELDALRTLSTAAGESSQERILKLMKEKSGGRQAGGHVPDTGMYKLHRGEAVLDAMTYESVKRGLREGGGGGATVNVTVNAAPNWTRQEFENAVVNVMGKVARRP